MDAILPEQVRGPMALLHVQMLTRNLNPSAQAAQDIPSGRWIWRSGHRAEPQSHNALQGCYGDAKYLLTYLLL